MLLKFLLHTLKNSMDKEEAQRLIVSVMKGNTLIDWLMGRYEPLEIEYQIATVFSIGMMISSYEYDLPSDDYYLKIIQSLDGIELTPDKIGELPAMIFMLPAFMTEDTVQMVTQVVE